MHLSCHEIKRWRSFSAMNASQTKESSPTIRLNIPMPCPPRGTVPVNQGRGLAGLFQPSTPGSLLVRDATAPAADTSCTCRNERCQIRFFALVDEAGQVGTRDFARLVDMVEAFEPLLCFSFRLHRMASLLPCPSPRATAQHRLRRPIAYEMAVW